MRMAPLLAALLASMVDVATARGAGEWGWVDVGRAFPGIVLDLRYARADNFLHQAVYPRAVCLLQVPVAHRLAAAQAALRREGYGLSLWDCYRPLSVQRRMWKLVPDPRWVADPAVGSNHNRGAAVDVTLVRTDGGALEMPTAFDDFSPRAAPGAGARWTPAARANYARLSEAMTAAGFRVRDTEWWHWDSQDAARHPVSDRPLTPIP